MSMAMGYSMKKRQQKKMANGGEVLQFSGKNYAPFREVAKSFGSDIGASASKAVRRSNTSGFVLGGMLDPEIAGDKEREDMESAEFNQSNKTKKMIEDSKGYAEGGEVEQDADMIARILHKRKEYSQGGMVANDVGVAEADKLPAEYDDLVLRDDLEDTSGPGNEIGNEELEEEDGDVVSKILSSRKKKDKMPRPA